MKSKILVTAISLVLSGAAMAADPTAPVAPVIPNLITTSQTATAALTESTTNRVLIDQSGNNPTVNIIQAGSGNAVGSEHALPRLTTTQRSVVRATLSAAQEGGFMLTPKAIAKLL